MRIMTKKTLKNACHGRFTFSNMQAAGKIHALKAGELDA